MKKIVVVIAVLFIITGIAAYKAPEEAVLGNKYKIIYLHLPLAYISFFSIFLCVLFSTVSLKKDYYAHGFIAAILGLTYGGGMLVFGFLLMKMAWGGISLSEPRFLGAIFLYSIFAYYLILHRKNRREWTATYALIGGMLGATVYILAKGNSRQLHPVDVVIPREMIYPLYISFLAFTLLYYYAFRSLLTWRTNEKH